MNSPRRPRSLSAHARALRVYVHRVTRFLRPFVKLLALLAAAAKSLRFLGSLLF